MAKRTRLGRIEIGTSGWNYPHWRAPFYQGAAPSEFLRLYARRFDSVEVNKSFYRLLTPTETRRWARQTGPSFRFAVKGSRFLTHMLKLKANPLAIRRFFTPLNPLGPKLGPVLFQLPPRWKPNVERLRTFLDSLPSGHRYAFELRNPEWIIDPVLALFRERGIAFCIYDFDGRATPVHVTADFGYVRLHGPGARYRGAYTPEQLRGWADWIETQARVGLDVYCYFDNDEKAFAAQNASDLIGILRERGALSLAFSGPDAGICARLANDRTP